MKNVLLTAAALTAFTLSADAQGYVPSVDQTQRQYSVSSQSANPIMSMEPVVETGLPSMNLPGMNTVYYQAETSPLVDGFGTNYNSYSVQSTTTNVSDRASSAASDPQEGRWIDRDNDGYDPVIDEVEQGVETAVKATGEALETAGEAVIDVFDGDDDEDESAEETKERGILGKVVNGTGKAIKGTAKTTGKVAKGTVKTTGKVVRGTGKAAVNGTKAVGRTTKKVVTPNKDNDINEDDN